MEPITIERCHLGFTVRQGDRYADEINFDEMLGLIVTLAAPDDIKYHHAGWMKTKEEWDMWHDRLHSINRPKRDTSA